MSKLYSTLIDERFKKVILLNENKDFIENSKFYVVASEYSATKIEHVGRNLSERVDVISLIPVVEYNIESDNNKGRILKNINSEFCSYKTNYLPTTFNFSKIFEAELIENVLIIKNKYDMCILKINLLEAEKIFLSNNESFSLLIIDGEDEYIHRIKFSYTVNNLPLFPTIKLSLNSKESEKKIHDIILNSTNLEKTLNSNLNTYLDTMGSSDYEVYESTTDIESLPSIRNLSFGTNCYACGKSEITREHCSPKWLTDKYKVKPLIGKIFCKDCNNWFGINFEKKAETKLKLDSKLLYDPQRNFISFWCIKTALTMSLASGVAINSEWLRLLRNEYVPDSFEVYYHTNMPFDKIGFNYGVSRFNNILMTQNYFLFTFICNDFFFIVLNTNKDLDLNLPFQRFFPTYKKPYLNEMIGKKYNFSDIHKMIHEMMSDEKTEDYSLPERKQYQR